ncbi:MAG: RNA methyltransferase [Stenotrophobium sp.]
MTDFPASDPPLSRVRIVLVATQHPGNIGAAARAMLTMGLTDLVLVSPQREPDEQSRAMAAGALEVLDKMRVVRTLDEAVADCAWTVAVSARPRHLGDEPLTPWDMAARTVLLPAPNRAALVFGCERTGLTNDELERCNATTMIAANPDYSSLNLAQAVQVMAYELRKAALPEVPKVSAKHEHPWYAPPSAEETERFYEHLEKVLRATGFLDPANPRVLMRRLRVLFNRAQPDRNELNILRGILTSVESPKIRTRRQP